MSFSSLFNARSRMLAVIPAGPSRAASHPVLPAFPTGPPRAWTPARRAAPTLTTTAACGSGRGKNASTSPLPNQSPSSSARATKNRLLCVARRSTTSGVQCSRSRTRTQWPPSLGFWAWTVPLTGAGSLRLTTTCWLKS